MPENAVLEIKMRYPAVTKYSSTQMGIRYSAVMPAKPVPAIFGRGAGIQVFLLDSRQKHAGMTSWGNGRSILWSCAKRWWVGLSRLTLFCCWLVLGLQFPALAGIQPAAAEKIQESVIAGSWYPGTETALRREVEEFLAQVPPMDPAGNWWRSFPPRRVPLFRKSCGLRLQALGETKILHRGHHCPQPPCSISGGVGVRSGRFQNAAGRGRAGSRSDRGAQGTRQPDSLLS